MVMLLTACLLSLAALCPHTWATCQLGDDVIVLTSWRGELSSPGYTQGQYPSDQRCQWDIRVSQGSRVKVTFVTFDLEDGYYKNGPPSPANLQCNDVVKVEDDGNSVLFEGCQSQGQGRTFESSGSRLSVTFVSDESGQKSGFTASYEGICQSVLSQAGFLESPGYPDPPPEGVGCQWEVTSPQKKILYIRPSDEDDGGHELPDCGSSLLNWEPTGSGKDASPKKREMCLADSKIVTRSDVMLTYQPNSTNRWTGRLFFDYSTQSGCDRYCEHGFRCFTSRSQDVGDYQCLCEAPYELGHNCEIYTNPCLAHNCSGAGVCTPVPDSVDFNCECRPGHSGKRCEVDLCEGVACLHGGTCMADERGTVTCLCPSDYTGSRCAIRVGEGHCKAEVDNTPGSGISWADTLAGHHDNQSCPTGIKGRAERHCMGDERSPTGAVWRRPDLSTCVSPQVYTLATRAQALRQAGVEGDLLYNVTRQLDNVTSELMTSEGGVYPGDLLSASDVLDDISHGVLTAASVHHDPPALAQHFTSSIGNILHPALLHAWSNARVHLVESKVASILTSAQRFAENLIQRQQGQDVMSGTASSSDTSTLLSSCVDNVELVVSEWGLQEGEGDDNASWTPTFPLAAASAPSLSPPHVFSSSSSSASSADPSPSSPPPSASLSLPQRAASVTLPSELLRIARADGSGRPVRVYTARFSTMGPLLSLRELRYSRQGEEEGEGSGQLVNSDVLSAEVLHLPPSAFSFLSTPVILTFPLTDPKKGGNLQKYCVFMNMTANAEERWLRKGCYLFEANASHVTCYCYHLTNFAVLLDVYDQADTLDAANSEALSYISYIGGSLSILSCVVVIVVFEFFRLRSERVRIHEQLAVSIILVQVIFFIGVGHTASGDTATSPQWGCKAVSILLHYSLTALFCWMLVEGIHLYLQLVRVFKHPSHLKKYCALGWGVPLLVVGISVAVFFQKYGQHNMCWLNREVLLVVFVPTVALVVSINVVILVLVVRVMLRSLNSTAKANAQQQSSVRSSVKACGVLLPLLGLTWVLGFLAVDTGQRGQPGVAVYLFTYLFTLCNSCQGLLFFLFHCLLNPDVHNAYERRYRQRKRALSSLETQTRKSSETSTYLADSSPHGKSTTRTMVSDMSLTSGDLYLANRRVHSSHTPPPPPLSPAPSHPSYSQDPSVRSTRFLHRRHSSSSHAARGEPRPHDVMDDVSGSVFDDAQPSDTESIWRRQYVTHDPCDNHFTISTLPPRRSPSYPNSPSRDVTDFVTSMENVLGAATPARTSVRFSEH
ncbi:cadherin EGF LAG seven-pass G-type receptor 1-like isoform X2 [Babylonia areolata]|uniref:cadherin EGF LAG seven-pass G-type receptor 1-like isoform X2 n=1 Tax=Babylonia areolata TaxID=304850 RepID=UPI003FD46C13